MDWDKLRLFKAVAEAGSFTHAGEHLNLSQSAISRQISTLEDSLGVLLFHRHARGLVLTEQGELLFHTATEVFDALQHVEARLVDSRLLPEGPLTITTVEFIASTWLAPHLSSFKSLYPDIQITMLLDDRVYDLSRREADAAIRLQPSEQNDMIQRRLKTLHFKLCVSKSYLERNGRPKSFECLAQHVLIGFPLGMQSPFLKPNWIFNRLGVNPHNNKNIILINSMNSRYSAIRSGAGIGVLPDYLCQNDPDLEILFPDLEIPAVDMYFVYPMERKNSKRIAVLQDFLFEQIKSNMM
ncbi:MAG: LysR family transcriptional regulator [Alphaproteobacteria bacterium]|nr:LysR family transcriptional regulator [Alphaproteobacteria bacterium]